MPVRRFRSSEDMKRLLWRTPGDPELAASIKAVWEFGRRTNPRQFPPGVFKHRSMAEPNAQTERWHRQTDGSRSSEGD